LEIWVKRKKPCSFGLKSNNNENNLFLVGLMFCSMTIIGQTEKKKATKRVGILRRVDRISQTASTEFPVVEVNCQTEMYMWGLYRIIN
jgi:hypothetical protein